ncbi:MAG TPA: hypothetical protein VG367_03070 [Mucilaginibacter sp.]|jgi:hypothetical protein|nr:hypothetical protein [Mucilaginibacter sp.]
MKKILLLYLIFLCTVGANAQVKLSDKDFNNLVALSELYSHNNMCKGTDFVKSADSLRTPVLNHIIDALLATGRADTSLMGKQFLSRPPHDELVLWFVIREVHYTRIDSAKSKPSSVEAAKNALAKNIDERWLLHNYYYFLDSGFAMLFNTADLSKMNIDIDDLGLKDETEKSIFFLSITDYMVRGRFMVLAHMKNNKRLMQYAGKMPMFNGKPYYYFTDLEFPDFDWSGYSDEKGTYKEVHIGGLIGTLAEHFSALANTGDKEGARDLYFHSILHKPEYFKYSTEKDMLQKIFDQGK